MFRLAGFMLSLGVLTCSMSLSQEKHNKPAQKHQLIVVEWIVVGKGDDAVEIRYRVHPRASNRIDLTLLAKKLSELPADSIVVYRFNRTFLPPAYLIPIRESAAKLSEKHIPIYYDSAFRSASSNVHFVSLREGDEGLRDVSFMLDDVMHGSGQTGFDSLCTKISTLDLDVGEDRLPIEVIVVLGNSTPGLTYGQQIKLFEAVETKHGIVVSVSPRIAEDVKEIDDPFAVPTRPGDSDPFAE